MNTARAGALTRRTFAGAAAAGLGVGDIQSIYLAPSDAAGAFASGAIDVGKDVWRGRAG